MIAFIRKWWRLLLGALGAIGAFLLGVLLRRETKPKERPNQEAYEALQQHIKRAEEIQREKEAIEAQREKTLAEIIVRANERKKERRRKRKQQEKEIQKRSESADPNDLRRELLEGANQIEEECDDD